MKKIFLVILTVITVLSTMVIITSAMSPREYVEVMEFNNTPKAYPIVDSLYDTVPFCEYMGLVASKYSVNFEITWSPDEIAELLIERVNNNLLVKVEFDTTYPNTLTVLYTTADGVAYDFGFYKQGESYYIAKFYNGTPTMVREIVIEPDGAGGYNDFSHYCRTELTEGHIVSWPLNPEKEVVLPITDNLLEVAMTFVTGIGGAFGTAFTSVFMTDGHLNVLSIVLLIFMGLTLGYGIIRFITGLFRKET